MDDTIRGVRTRCCDERLRTPPKGWTLAVLVWASRRLARCPLDVRSIGLSSDPSTTRHPFPLATAILVALVALGFSLTIGSSSGNASAYGTVRHVGFGLALGELVVRYPISAFVEEAFFRGWLQPRLGRQGPVLVALLWAIYHLQQISTIPSLVLYGLVLGFVRWWTRTIRMSGIIHYVGNAIFFVSNYV